MADVSKLDLYDILGVSIDATEKEVSTIVISSLCCNTASFCGVKVIAEYPVVNMRAIIGRFKLNSGYFLEQFGAQSTKFVFLRPIWVIEMSKGTRCFPDQTCHLTKT